MDNFALSSQFADLSAPLIADACVRLKIPLRIAPPEIRPLISGSKLAGRVAPVRHYGSVDVFLEAMMTAEAGDVLVIDNGGRTDEGCIGDLTALEARASGLAGMVVWGSHRDTAELLQIGFPVFSCGVCPAGPLRLDQRESEALSNARMGEIFVTREDAVFADDDGALFVPFKSLAKIIMTAQAIRETERRQAELLRNGKKLKDQLHFDDYLHKRSADPSSTFREHLREIGGAIEE